MPQHEIETKAAKAEASVADRLNPQSPTYDANLDALRRKAFPHLYDANGKRVG